jgi:hypothetical protein
VAYALGRKLYSLLGESVAFMDIPASHIPSCSQVAKRGVNSQRGWSATAKTAKGVLLQRPETGGAIKGGMVTILVSVEINDRLVMTADSASSYANGIICNHSSKIVIPRQGLPLGAMVFSGQAQGHGTMKFRRVLNQRIGQLATIAA